MTSKMYFEVRFETKFVDGLPSALIFEGPADDNPKHTKITCLYPSHLKPSVLEENKEFIEKREKWLNKLKEEGKTEGNIRFCRWHTEPWRLYSHDELFGFYEKIMAVGL